jgi:hypothetical protein
MKERLLFSLPKNICNDFLTQRFSPRFLCFMCFYIHLVSYFFHLGVGYILWALGANKFATVKITNPNPVLAI